MRHHDRNRTFGRTTRQRTALLRNLAESLIVHERIETTAAKAKELRPFIERLVTQGKEDTPVHRRLVAARLGGAPRATKKLFEALAPRYAERAGGYTRIVKSAPKAGDARKMAFIEFV